MTSERQPVSASDRDTEQTGFSRHLDQLIGCVPEALCAAFVDGDGETVDLASKIDLFDARIAGAEMAIALDSVRRTCAKTKIGSPLEVRIEGTERCMLARHVGEGYNLVVLLQGHTLGARAAEATAEASTRLLVEAGFDSRTGPALLRSVEQRSAPSGLQFPRAFELAGRRRRVESVLGHSIDGSTVQFLVRLDDGEELFVVHRTDSHEWVRGET